MHKHINYFEINPSDPVQLILGTNGSGKSSIIAELSPLPANKEDYFADGYKEVHILKDGDIYVLKSSFNPKQHHSITRNGGDNLNEGGTITVQRELVNQIFGITADIHEILTSAVKFTKMSVSDRRYWFTRLSNTNYDYVIRVYNKIKDKHRDITGTIKTLKKRLVQEMEKIVDIDYQSKLEREVDEIHSFLGKLLEIRKPLDETKEELLSQENNLYAVIGGMTATLMKAVNLNPGIGRVSYESLENDIVDCQGSVRVYDAKSDEFMDRIRKLDDTIALLEKTQGNSIDELTQRLLTCQLKAADVNRHFTFSIDDELQSNRLSDAINSVNSTLVEISTNLFPNADKQINRVAFQEANKKLSDLLLERNTLQTRLNALQARKQHQEVHRDTPAVKCPKCSHTWHLNYTESTYKSILDEMETVAQEIHSNNESISKTETSIESMQKYFSTYNSYNNLVRNWPVLSPLWDKIESSNVILERPYDLPSIVQDFLRNIDLKKEYELLMSEDVSIRAMMQSVEQVGGQDMAKLKEEREELDTQMFINSQNIQKARQKINQLQSVKTNKRQIDEMANLLEKYLGDSKDIFDKTNESIRREILNDCIRSIQTTLSRKELAISEIRGQRSIIGDIENQINLLTSDEKALKLLVDEMSPTDGLIAEGLYGFIRVFVTQMNTFISKVWTYPMIIQACNVEGDDKVELDYKFPIHNPNTSKANSTYAPVPDVSKASTGQQEIINLAWMVLAMRQLGLGSAPICLDEFAANMDNSHRIAAIGVVKSLLEQYSFTQLFMVNHYDGIYGAFTNAQMTVLCDENIVIPKDCVYNRHVVIK